MNSATIIINYGLAAINATTDSANAGMSAFLLICKNACYQVGNDITGDSYAELTQDTEKTDKLIPLGQVGNGGKIDKQYVNVTPWYLDGDPEAEPDPDNDWKYRVLVVRNAEDGGDIYGTVVDASEAVMFRPDPIDFTLSLATKSGGELLDANDSLEITVTCPDAIFEQDGALSEGGFSQEVAVYWLTEGVGVGEIFSTEATHGLVASKKLDKNTRQFTVIDSGTGHEGFNPSSTYRYAAVIRAYASNNNTIYSDEIVVGTASGDTDACLKFSNTYEAGQLWVGDLAENIVSAQNTSGTQSFGDTSFKRVNLGGKHLNIVAFKGNAGSFESWLEGTVNAAEFGQIAYANLPPGLGGYDASVSGTFRMYLDLLEDPLQPLSVSVEKKNDLNLVYNGSTGYSVSDLFNIGISDPENGEGVIVTYQVVGENNDAFLENPTITDAGTYKIKIKFACDGYNTFISDSGNGEGYEVEIAKKELTLANYSIPSIDQDSVDRTVNVGNATLSGFVANEEDLVAIQACTCTYDSTDTAGTSSAVISTTLTGQKAGNYYVADLDVTGTVNQISVPGISVSQVAHPVYNGEPQEVPGFLAVRGTKTGDIITYSLDGTTYSDSVSVTDGGIHHVWVKVVREGYAPCVEDLNFIVDQKTLSVRILPEAVIPPAYQNEEMTFELGSGYEIVGLVGNDSVEVTTAGGTYVDTSTTGTSKAIDFLFILENGREDGNYITAITDTENIGTVLARKTVTLTDNTGQESNENQDAITTTALTMTLSQAIDAPALTLADLSVESGSEYITIDSVTLDDQDTTGKTYILGVTRTGTAGDGNDTLTLKVNRRDVDPTPVPCTTHLVTAYWGVYPCEEEDPVPSFADIIASGGAHGLTVGVGQMDYYLHYYGLGQVYFLAQKSIGSVSFPENTAHVPLQSFQEYDETALNNENYAGRWNGWGNSDAQLKFTITANSNN